MWLMLWRTLIYERRWKPELMKDRYPQLLLTDWVADPVLEWRERPHCVPRREYYEDGRHYAHYDGLFALF